MTTLTQTQDQVVQLDLPVSETNISNWFSNILNSCRAFGNRIWQLMLDTSVMSAYMEDYPDTGFYQTADTQMMEQMWRETMGAESEKWTEEQYYCSSLKARSAERRA